MSINGRTVLVTLAAATFAACGPNVTPDAVSWRSNAPVITPASNAVAPLGALRVETDTDLRETGGQTFYNVRRSYSVYSPDGRLVRRIANRGGRSGEQPVVAELPPGHYVVATMFGTVYRRVDVDVQAGRVTRVSADALRDAPPVFTQVGSR